MARLPRGLVLAADLAGTGLFAVEGALIARAALLDWFGIAVIAFTSSLGGGVLRDLMLGAAPPAAFRDQRYPLIAVAAAALVIVAGPRLTAAPPHALMLLDAAALALFAVVGTEKALAATLASAPAALIGTLTAVGGGVLRDVLLAGVPAVLRVDIYATAALGGALVLIAARACKVPASMAAGLGGLACFGLRVAAYLSGWHLPVPGAT